jgi:hypothetical protein
MESSRTRDINIQINSKDSVPLHAYSSFKGWMGLLLISSNHVCGLVGFSASGKRKEGRKSIHGTVHS